jgi:hypothetical protein
MVLLAEKTARGRQGDQCKWGGRLKMRFILGCALVIAIWTNAAAAENGCEKFAWSVVREHAALLEPNLPVLSSGASIESTGRAFKLLLRTPEEAGFAMPPQRTPRMEAWRGGFIRLPAPRQPAIYQVTLSDEAWVDVIQEGRYAPLVGSWVRNDCPGLRMTLRFEVTANPIVLQISGVWSKSISVVIGPAR